MTDTEAARRYLEGKHGCAVTDNQADWFIVSLADDDYALGEVQDASGKTIALCEVQEVGA